MTIESLLTRELDIRFIDARNIAESKDTQAKTKKENCEKKPPRFSSRVRRKLRRQ
jgi:hypothetical protein